MHRSLARGALFGVVSFVACAVITYCIGVYIFNVRAFWPESITPWFPAAWFLSYVALPSLFSAGVVAAAAGRSRWWQAAALSGLIGSILLLFVSSAPWLWWYWGGVVTAGTIISLAAGLVGYLFARYVPHGAPEHLVQPDPSRAGVEVPVRVGGRRRAG